jgi:hypothetical protein
VIRVIIEMIISHADEDLAPYPMCLHPLTCRQICTPQVSYRVRTCKVVAENLHFTLKAGLSQLPIRQSATAGFQSLCRVITLQHLMLTVFSLEDTSLTLRC